MSKNPESSYDPKSFWNQMFESQNYVYGELPNEFWAQCLEQYSFQQVLLPCEGEGQNACYAAQKGLDVCAYDISPVARAKALKLAKHLGVHIDYRCSDFLSISFEKNFDAVALLFGHLPLDPFRQGLKKLKDKVLPYGFFCLEIFAPRHLESQSNMGPKNKDLYIDKNEIDYIFEHWHILRSEEKQVLLNHGRHQGQAWVIQFIAQNI